MKQLFTTACLLAVGLCAINAAPITRNQAKVIASKYISKMPSSDTRVLEPQSGDNQSYYVFSRGENAGFVIVSGDDQMPELVGYTEKGDFSSGRIPSNLKHYLEDYERVVKKVQSDTKLGMNISLVPQLKSKSYPAVTPLITSKWDQATPFNKTLPKWIPDYDPTDEGFDVLTGCVATAMAQVMNYYKYPAATQLPIEGFRDTVNWNGDDGYIDVPAIPVNSAIDWNNMLSTYEAEHYNDAQANAVAKLMQYCGASVRMEYTPEFSGAFVSDAAKAMRNVFGYDDICRHVYSFSYKGIKWVDLLHSELEAGRPIIYGGSSVYPEESGHCFILDGVNIDGMFHVNWGWGGLFDGYYDISILNPYIQPEYAGISDGFAYQQEAIVGIRQDNGVADVNTLEPLFMMYNYFALSAYTVTGSEGKFKVGMRAPLFNMNLTDENVQLAIAYENESGELVRVCLPVSLSLSSGMGNYVDIYMTGDVGQHPIMQLPVGKTVKLFVVYDRGDGVWHPASDAQNMYISASVSIDGTQLAFSYPNYSLKATLVPDQTFYHGMKNQMNFKIRNNSDIDFDGPLYLLMSKTQNISGANIAFGSDAYLLSDTTSNFTVFTFSVPSPDKYYYWLCYYTGNNNEPHPIASGSIDIIERPMLTLVDAYAISKEDRRISASVYGEQAMIPWIWESDNNKVEVVFKIQNNTENEIQGAFYIDEWWVNPIDATRPYEYGFPFWEPIQADDNDLNNPKTVYTLQPGISQISYAIDMAEGQIPSTVYTHIIGKFVSMGDTINVIPCETSYPTPDGTSQVVCKNGAVWFHYMTDDVVAGINAVAADNAAVKVVAVDGGIKIIAVDKADVDIVTIAGAAVTNVKLDAGESRTIALPSGIYMVGKTKVVVR